MNVRRRVLLSTVATTAAAGAVAGCLDAVGEGGRELPENCPTTQGLDVEWPEELTRETAEEFVEAYANVYYREEVVDYTPESRVDSYGISVGVMDVREAGDGYELEVSGSGGVYQPTLHLSATVADPPADRNVVALEAVDDDTVRGLLEEAAETPEEEPTLHIDRPGRPVERYLELFERLNEGFGPMTGPGDSGTLYVDVDGQVVELTVQADNFHGDYWVGSAYYVDEHVLRRTDEDGVDPQDGELLECRREV